MSDKVSKDQQRSLPFNVQSVPLHIDGKTVAIGCITTEYGDIVFAAIDYVMAFTGCAHKDASNKLSSLYSAIPLLRPPKHELRHYSKVYIYIFHYICLNRVLTLSCYRLL